MSTSKKAQEPRFDDVRIVAESAERRHEDRISPDLDIPCEIKGARVVHILGLSVGAHGMRVLTDVRLPHDQEIPIRLRLGKQGRELEMQGTVAWDDEKDFEIFKRYVSGIHFSRIAEPDARELQDYLKQYVERDRRR
ncbi:MAG: PilZ domain-containing protein [Candidatus Xenobia bacterium]